MLDAATTCRLRAWRACAFYAYAECLLRYDAEGDYHDHRH